MNASRTAPLTLVPRFAPDPRQALTDRVKQLARIHGLSVTAITTADPFPEVADHLDKHIAEGHMAGLDWFTSQRALVASDVRNLQPSAVSILSVAIAYWPGPTEKPDDGIVRGRISRYAWGKDYHRVIKRRLTALQSALEAELGRELETRRLVDTARIVERAVAARAGLGWYGKHSCLIVPGHGSWVLLGELVLDLDLVPDTSLDRNCGRCTICIDRCPTGAIVAPYKVHTPICISYLTIELREAIPAELRSQMGDWVYGCDVCQEVCPYTGAAQMIDDADLGPHSIENAYPSLHWLLTMTQQEFGATYHGTAVPRAKRRGLARNAAVALGNIGTESDVPILVGALSGHDEPLVRGHSAWALGRIGARSSRQALDRGLRMEPDPFVVAEIRDALLQN
jgi:epoxyqueuosine reductase